MKFKELLDAWTDTSRRAQTARETPIRLTLDDAARVRALAELFPGHSEEEILTDLVAVALQELEGAMPYRPGNKVIAQDEQGDPIYEDAGLTPRFAELVRKYRQELARQG